MRIAKLTIILVFAALLAWPQKAKSQDDSSAQTGASSAPAQGAPGPGSEGQGEPQDQPDNNPLSGAILSTVGSLPEVHSYLQPELLIGEEAFSNPGYAAGPSSSHFQSITVPMGGLSLDLFGRQNTFVAQYLGGGFIDNSKSALDSQFHELSLMDDIRFRRGMLVFADSFSYSPETNFGFAGAGVLGGFGTGLTPGLGASTGMGQISPMVGANESILTTGYGATGNTAVVEAEYLLSPHTSIVGTGAYGTLQFGNGSGYLDGNHADGLVGLDHRLTAKDTIGVSYMYGTFHYTGSPVFFNSQKADIRYGRKITGRLGLQLYAGPEFISYHTAPGRVTSSTYVSGTANLSYVWYRNTFGVYAGRFASGGSGVVPGAETTTISGSWGRELTRTWTSAVYGGYSQNSGYAFSPTSPTRPAGVKTPNYNYWFGNLTLTRPLSRHLRLNIGYEYQRSTSNTGPCTSGPCAGNLTNQTIGLGIAYVPNPIQL